jgi:hypothetical protein
MSDAKKAAQSAMEAAASHYAWNEDTAKRQKELDALGVSIKPIALSSAAAVAPPGVTSPLGSAWNTAGTWEERDVTRSATAALESRLAAFASQPRSGKRVHLVSASVSGGHVTLIASRGKLRVGYELTLSATWEIREEGGGGGALARGTLNSPMEDSDSDIFTAFNCSKSEGTLPTGEAVALVKLVEDALRKEVKAWVEDTKKV